jgi:hypothetical protein
MRYSTRKIRDLQSTLRIEIHAHLLILNLYFCFKKLNFNMLCSLCSSVCPLIRGPELRDTLQPHYDGLALKSVNLFAFWFCLVYCKGIHELFCLSP